MEDFKNMSLEQTINYMNIDCDHSYEVLKSPSKFIVTKDVALKAANMEVSLETIKLYCGEKHGDDLDVCREVISANGTYGMETIKEDYKEMSKRVQEDPNIKLEIFKQLDNEDYIKITKEFDMNLTIQDYKIIGESLQNSVNKEFFKSKLENINLADKLQSEMAQKSNHIQQKKMKI